MRAGSIFAVSVAFASSLLLCSSFAIAQSTANDAQSTANNTSVFNHNIAPGVAMQEAAQMVPAQAVLAQEIDARKMRDGQQFKAKLTDTVHLKNGVELPKDTFLVGTVVTDKMGADGTSTLTLRFTQAQLRDGKTIPVEAAIVGIAPPEYGATWDGTDEQAPPTAWNGQTLQVDQVGAFSGTDLHSAIAANDSAILVSHNKDNMKLSDQTQLSLAIGPSGSNQNQANNAGA